ncbi:MAG: hypothetical protein Q4F67_00520 [Propionibacteriaceae bacterium]|nr:hypothetical protein [Propionibacteriaceae bacterium]
MGHAVVTRPRRAAPEVRPDLPGPAIGSHFHVLVLAVSLAYALVARAELQAFSAHHGFQVNAWDQVLKVVHDPYLIAYLILPIWLVRSGLRVRSDALPQVMIRSHSRITWLARSYRHALIDAFAVIGLFVVAAAVSAVGLPWTWGWSALATDPELAGFTVHAFVGTGLPAAALVAGQALHLGLGLASVSVLLAFVQVRTHRPVVGYTVMVAVWLLTIIALRRPIEAFDVSDTFFLLHALTSLGPAAPVAVLWLPTGLLVTQTLLSRTDVRGISVTPVICGLAGALVLLQALTTTATDLPGAIMEGFYGGQQITQYSFVALLALAPVWLFAARLSDVLGGSWVHAELTRSRSLVSWAARLVWPWIGVSFAMLAGSIALLAGGHLVGLGVGTDTLETPPTLLMAYQLGINGSLQGAVLLILVFLARWLSGQEIAAVIAVGAAMVLGFPGLNQGGWVPIMLHQLHWAPDWPQTLAITARLIITIAITLLIAGGLFARPGLRCHERNL